MTRCSTLWDLVATNPPLLQNRTEVEDAIHACIPDGDTDSDVEQHVLYTPPNPYVGVPQHELFDRLETLDDPEQARLVRQALTMQRARHQGLIPEKEPSKYTSKTPGQYQVDKQVSIRAGNGLKGAY